MTIYFDIDDISLLPILIPRMQECKEMGAMIGVVTPLDIEDWPPVVDEVQLVPEGKKPYECVRDKTGTLVTFDEKAVGYWPNDSILGYDIFPSNYV